MNTTTPPITAASFEKVFVRNWTARITRLQSHSSPDEYLVAEEKYQDFANWREIAWKALEEKKLGDSLRRAVVSLPKKYREVLFLRDVKESRYGGDCVGFEHHSWRCESSVATGKDAG